MHIVVKLGEKKVTRIREVHKILTFREPITGAVSQFLCKSGFPESRLQEDSPREDFHQEDFSLKKAAQTPNLRIFQGKEKGICQILGSLAPGGPKGLGPLYALEIEKFIIRFKMNISHYPVVEVI